MKFFTYLRTLGFTRNETNVIVLLSSTFLIGLTLRYFNIPGKSPTSPQTQFTYASSDSIFKTKSARSRESTAAASSDSAQTGRKKDRKSSAPATIININSATKSELMLLPGIGEAYAERIMIYRNDHGPFKSVDDLENINGIGKKKLERIRPFVKVK